MEEKIQCPICLNFYHNITGKHLLKHSYKNIKSFKEDFPNSKTISEKVSLKYKQNLKEKIIPKAFKTAQKAKKTKIEKYGNGFGKNWNNGLTKETDERVKKNGENIKKIWQNKSDEEKKIHGNNVRKNLSGKTWEIIFGIEKSTIKKSKYREMTLGNKSAFYIDGRCNNEYSYGDNWINIRKNIYKRDNYTCQDCNRKDKKLLCHHIKDFKSFPINQRNEELNNSHHEFNLITLCFSCHSKLTSKKIKQANTVRYLELIKSKYLVTTTYL